MGCGSSHSVGSASSPHDNGLGVVPDCALAPHVTSPAAAANSSLISFSGGGTPSHKRLQPASAKRDSLTFGQTNKEKEKEEQAKLIGSSGVRSLAWAQNESATTQQLQSGSGGGDGGGGGGGAAGDAEDFDEDSLDAAFQSVASASASIPATAALPVAAASSFSGEAGEEDDSSDSGSDSEDEDEESSSEDESMEEIQEEEAERPIDEGLFTPAVPGVRTIAAPSTAALHGLHRTSSLTRLLRSFAPEACHILVVDDDAQSQEIVGQWLTHKRYHVTLCSDGEEAVEVLSACLPPGLATADVLGPTPAAADSEAIPINTPSFAATATTVVAESGHTSNHSSSTSSNAPRTEDFSLILCEHAMESPSGMPLLEWILRTPHTRHIPVVLMSFDASTQCTDRALRRGAEDFLRKPLQRSVLLKNIRTILETRLEQANSRKLKEWGDNYKRQIALAEKEKKRLLQAQASDGSNLTVQQRPQQGHHPTLSADASADNPAAATAAEATPGIAAPPVSASDEAADTIVPNALLVKPSSRRQLSIHVPSSDVTAIVQHQPLALMKQLSQPLGSHSHSPTNLARLTSSAALGPGMTPADLDHVAASVHEATVLLVDPSDTTRSALSQWLASIQYKLILQSSLEEALAFLQRQAAARGVAPPNRSATMAFPKAQLLLQHAEEHKSHDAQDPQPRFGGLVTPESATTPTGMATGTTSAVDSPALSPHGIGVSTATTMNPRHTMPGVGMRQVSMATALAQSSATAAAASATPICDLIIADAEPFTSGSSMMGSGFISAIQSHPALKSIPVLLLYSSHASQDVSDSIRLGVESILLKPVSRELLLKAVNRTLTVIAQKRKSIAFGERAQLYRNILRSFRSQREEDIRAGKRLSPMTPLTRRQSCNRSLLEAGIDAQQAVTNSSTAASTESSPVKRKHALKDPCATAAEQHLGSPDKTANAASTPSRRSPLSKPPLSPARQHLSASARQAQLIAAASKTNEESKDAATDDLPTLVPQPPLTQQLSNSRRRGQSRTFTFEQVAHVNSGPLAETQTTQAEPVPPPHVSTVEQSGLSAVPASIAATVSAAPSRVTAPAVATKPTMATVPVLPRIPGSSPPPVNAAAPSAPAVVAPAVAPSFVPAPAVAFLPAISPPRASQPSVLPVLLDAAKLQQSSPAAPSVLQPHPPLHGAPPTATVLGTVSPTPAETPPPAVGVSPPPPPASGLGSGSAKWTRLSGTGSGKFRIFIRPQSPSPEATSTQQPPTVVSPVKTST